MSMSIELVPADIWSETWARGYFPEDMPVSWQLDYYLNEFNILVVDETRVQMFDDESADTLCRALQEGLILISHRAWYAPILQPDYRLYALSDAESPWEVANPDEHGWVFSDCRVEYCSLCSEATPRDLRHTIDALIKRCVYDRALILVRGTVQDFERLQILLQLMGLDG